MAYQYNVVWYLGIPPSSCGSAAPNKAEQSIKVAAKACENSWNELTDEEMEPDTSKASDIKTYKLIVSLMG